MINLNGITDIKTEEINHISNLEPTESYFKCYLVKDGVKGEGLGETKGEALIDAIDWIESYNAETEK